MGITSQFQRAWKALTTYFWTLMYMHDTTNQMRGSLRRDHERNLDRTTAAQVEKRRELEEKQILRQINSKTFDISDCLPVCSQLIKILWAHGNIDTYSSASVLRYPCDIMSNRIVAPCCQSASMFYCVASRQAKRACLACLHEIHWFAVS